MAALCPELSVICSNLARGCEKQYLPEQEKGFRELAEFFRARSVPAPDAGTQALLQLVERDLSSGLPYAHTAAGEAADPRSAPGADLERKGDTDAAEPAQPLREGRGGHAGAYRRLRVFGLRLCLCGGCAAVDLPRVQGAGLEI